MAERWITVNGTHILLKDGQSVDEAFKERQIAANKAEADNLNVKERYNDKFGINLIHADNLDIEYLKDSEKLLQRLYEDKEVSSFIPKGLTIEAVSFSKKFTGTKYENMWALSQRDTSGLIYVNEDRLKDYNNAKDSYSRSDKYVKGTTPASILIHEIAHKIEYNIAAEAGKQINKHEIAREIVQKAYDKCASGFKTINDARSSISKYANTNYTIFTENDLPAYEETLAEAFSDYYTNKDKSAKFSKAIIVTARDYIKKKGK